VGHRDDGGAHLLLEAFHVVDDLLPGLAVEVAGGFVGEDQRGPRHQGAGDGDALLLAAG
jgi:hypothetical protein